MKRKLNDNNVPEPAGNSATSAGSGQVATTEKLPIVTSFTGLGLDARLLEAIMKQSFTKPTPIQSAAIPVALSGRDILARAKTGSGKTAAYALPLLQRILRSKEGGVSSDGGKTSALILVPTRELAAQVTKAVIQCTSSCRNSIRIENVTRKEEEKVLRARLAQAPDVIVATPSRANNLVAASVIQLAGLASLVIDEADLVISYGHKEDLTALSSAMPEGVQTILTSATLRTEVEELKELFCKDPVLLEMDDVEREDKSLQQYVVKCGEDEKFLLLYAIFMLKLIKGKVIIFVADIDRCYRLKLFLEQFGIRSCVLNSELPANSRIHVVEEFNRNIYDIIIASDENEVVGSEEKSATKKNVEAGATEAEPAALGEENLADVTTGELGDSAPPKKKRRQRERDTEYGISRGIDFKNVSCVLNFDLPPSSKSYTHRIGRTARAGKTGMALSFYVPAALFRKHKPTSIPSCAADEATLAKMERAQTKKGQSIEPYDFDMSRLDGFRYRMSDALRAVTRVAVRDARAKEIRTELLNSEKLKRHFEENPADLAALRHDGETRAVRVQHHLKHVPEYLLPDGPKSVLGGNVGFAKIGENRIRAARKRNLLKSRGKGGKKSTRAKGDPLKSLGKKRA